MKPSLKKTLVYILYVALLAAAIFAALQIRQFVIHHQETSPITKSGQTGQSTTAPEFFSVDDDTAVNPMKLATMPMGAGGLEPFDADPENIAPPAGARATAGYQQRAYHSLRQQRVYECAPPLKAAADHYRHALTAKGFVEVSDLPGPGSLSLGFSSGGVHVSVTISTQKPTGKLRVTVVSSREE